MARSFIISQTHISFHSQTDRHTNAGQISVGGGACMRNEIKSNMFFNKKEQFLLRMLFFFLEQTLEERTL
jgi:hypothetical protein